MRLPASSDPLERRAVLAGFVSVAAVSGTRFSYAVALPHLSEHLSVQAATIAAAFTVHWVAFTLTAPLAWRAFVRFGTTTMFRLGGIACGGGFALLATVGSAWQSILWFGVLVGVGTHGIGQLSSNHPVLLTSAPHRRDRRFGIVACGSPVGTAAFPALMALGVDWYGWRSATVLTGALVVAVTWLAAYAVAPIVEPTSPPVERGSRVRDPRLSREPSFLFLAMAFFLALLVQTSVPFIVPVWGERLDLSAAQLAAVFLVLGASGLVGRLVMTSLRPAFSLHLWVAVPAGALAVAGCAVAIPVGDPLWLFVSVTLLGLSSPVFGALFAIAALACFPTTRYAEVLGSLLIPVGLGASLAPVLPMISIDRGMSFTVMWLVLGAMTACCAGLIIAAEVSSPVRRAARRSRTGSCDRDATTSEPSLKRHT